ncbi:MAG: NAD(P)H-dependent glycerol-3-phosphate dehydrogenase [Pseudomonadota bacterium]
MAALVAIYGAGAFGRALAAAIPAPTRLVGRRAGEGVETNLARGFEGAGWIVLAVPAQATRAALAAIAPALPARAPLILAAKGIERGTGALQHEIAAAAAPGRAAMALTGPSFAADLTAGLPTALTLAAEDEAAGRAAQERIAGSALRPYLTDDLIGAEMGGALKNVIAVACGAAVGAGLGESARAALMTRGFAEITRMAVARGGRAETLAGLSGLGDLALTCASPTSRNFAYGLSLSRGEPPPEGVTTEGRETAGAAAALARSLGVDAPVIAAVAALAAGETDVAGAMAALLARPLRSEG